MVDHAQRLGLDDTEAVTPGAPWAKIDVGDEKDFPSLPNAKARPNSEKTGPSGPASPLLGSTSPPRIPLFSTSPSPFSLPPPIVNTSTLAAKLAIQSLAASFPQVSKDEIEQYYRRAGTLDSTRALIQSSTGYAPLRTPAPNKPTSRPLTAPLPASRDRREVDTWLGMRGVFSFFFFLMILLAGDCAVDRSRAELGANWRLGRCALRNTSQ